MTCLCIEALGGEGEIYSKDAGKARRIAWKPRYGLQVSAMVECIDVITTPMLGQEVL
jgi:hypothetical protein